jgi:alginate O-acetyltransferase complex protein AlgJ
MQVEQNGVHIGKDGWLFLAAGSNEALRLLTDIEWFVAEDAQNWALKLTERQKRLESLGARYVHLWVPDKIKVYREHLNLDQTLLQVDPASMVYHYAHKLGMADVLVNLMPEFTARKTERLLYWKTDTHWTYWGACTAHQVLCKSLNTEPPADLWDRPIHSIALALDLGSKLSPELKEDWGGAQTLRDSKIVYKNELVKLLEILNPTHAAPMLRGTSVQFENSRPTCDERRVIIFGDSFSEYRPHLLTGLLAETYRHVLFVWSTSIDYGLVERFRPDIVITEMAERFIKTLPEKNIPLDGFDLDAFVLDRIVSFLNSQCGNGHDPFSWRHEALGVMHDRYARVRAVEGV